MNSIGDKTLRQCICLACGALLVLSAAGVLSCKSGRHDQSTVDEQLQLVTIRYVLEPFRTFAIDGIEPKGIPLSGLTRALIEHHKTHCRATYEVLAEVKSTNEDEVEIIKAIGDAGIQLEHYWAPVSFATNELPPDASHKYGPGYVDTLPPRPSSSPAPSR